MTIFQVLCPILFGIVLDLILYNYSDNVYVTFLTKSYDNTDERIADHDSITFSMGEVREMGSWQGYINPQE